MSQDEPCNCSAPFCPECGVYDPVHKPAQVRVTHQEEAKRINNPENEPPGIYTRRCPNCHHAPLQGGSLFYMCSSCGAIFAAVLTIVPAKHELDGDREVTGREEKT